MKRREREYNRPTWKDIIHYDLNGSPACGISAGRIFVSWNPERVDCTECLKVMKIETAEQPRSYAYPP